MQSDPNRVNICHRMNYFSKVSIFLVWIEPRAHTHWGYWGAVKVCSPGHNVVGAQLRIEPKQGWGDDTALNAIRFTCSNGMVLISAEGNWGDWRGYTKSHSNEFVGIRMRTESSQGNNNKNV